MKPLLFLLAMALPVSAAATVAMEPLQATRSQPAAQPQPADGHAHRQLFIVKYVLRRPPPDEAPQIVMDDAKPHIVPPSADDPGIALGALDRQPNTVVCYGWGCERRP